MSSSAYTAEHWWNRAEEARIVAEAMMDPAARESALRIASKCDAMANKAIVRDLAARVRSERKAPRAPR